jgi:hypothetical protein
MFNLWAIHDIGSHNKRVTARRCNLRCDLIELLSGSRSQADAGSFFCTGKRDGSADSTAAARH